MEDLIKMRDIMREAADLIDEIAVLKTKEDNGADITKECESILGKFMLKMIEMECLQSKL